MTALDEERFLEGSRDVKTSIAFGFLFFFLLIGAIVFAIAVFAVAENQSSPNFEFAVGAGLFAALISVVLWLLVRYYFHLYRRPQSDYSDLGYNKPTPAQCVICKRHPTSRRYHIRKVHGIRDGRKIGEFYENCGCKYCVKPIYMQGYG